MCGVEESPTRQEQDILQGIMSDAEVLADGGELHCDGYQTFIVENQQYLVRHCTYSLTYRRAYKVHIGPELGWEARALELTAMHPTSKTLIDAAPTEYRLKGLSKVPHSGEDT